MKIGKITLVLTCCGMAFQTGMAQELPKWANKARKAVFSVITYNRESDSQYRKRILTLMKTVQPYPIIRCLKGPNVP